MRSARRIYYLRTRLEDIIEEEAGWYRSFARRIQCKTCGHRGCAWRESAVSIDVVLQRLPKFCCAMASGSLLVLLRKDLADELLPFAHALLVGQVYVRTQIAAKLAVNYVTLVTPPNQSIDPYRGRSCQHRVCAGCGRAWSVSYADTGIVERTLDERMVYQDDDGALYVDGELIRRLKLESRFPDLRFVRIPLLEAPLDGDVLPGDPGWDGIFRPQSEKLKGRL